MKFKNVTGRTDAVSRLDIGDSLLWVPEYVDTSTDMKHLQTSARTRGIKVSCRKVLLVVEGEVSEVLIKVERVE